MPTDTTTAKNNEWALPLIIIACFFIEGVWTLANAWILLTTHLRPRYVSMGEAGALDILDGIFGKDDKTYIGGLLLIFEGVFFIAFPFYIEFFWSRRNQLNKAQRRAVHHSTIWTPIIFLLAGAAILCDQLGYVTANILFTIILISAAIWARVSKPKEDLKSNILDPGTGHG